MDFRSQSSAQRITAMKTNVYIVDDHALVRHGLSNLIAAEPDLAVCGQSADATVALREIVALVPHVAIVDLSLGTSGSGLQLVKDLHRSGCGVQVCVFSVHDESTFGLRALRAGAHGYVMKHDSPERVLEAIRCLARGQHFISDKIIQRFLEPLDGANPDNPVNRLTDRELEVMELIGRGTTTNEIAMQLHVGRKTVEAHRARLKQKLRVRSGPELMRFCSNWVRDHES